MVGSGSSWHAFAPAVCHLREQVVPGVTQAPGFVAGYWTRTESRGGALVEVDEPWEPGEYEIAEVIDRENDKVVMHMRRHVRGKTGGTEADFDYWWVGTFRNGKGVRSEWFAEREQSLGGRHRQRVDHASGLDVGRSSTSMEVARRATCSTGGAGRRPPAPPADAELDAVLRGKAP